MNNTVSNNNCCCCSAKCRYICTHILLFTTFIGFSVTIFTVWSYFLAVFFRISISHHLYIPGDFKATWYRPSYGLCVIILLYLFTIRLLTLNDVKSSSSNNNFVFGYSKNVRILLVIGVVICHIFYQFAFILGGTIGIIILCLMYGIFYTILVILYLKQIIMVLHFKIDNNDKNSINNNNIWFPVSIKSLIQYCVLIIIGFVSTFITLIIVLFGRSFINNYHLSIAGGFVVCIDSFINAIIAYCFYPFGEKFYHRLCAFMDKFCRKYILLKMAGKKYRYNDNTNNNNDNDNGQDIELKNLLSAW